MPLPTEGITAIRLQLPPDEPLLQTRPGRAGKGNLMLSVIELWSGNVGFVQQEFILGAVTALNKLGQLATGDLEIATRVAQYESAFRMQTSVTELTDLSDVRDKCQQACLHNEY